jgi:iron complex outermembrane receptor protein
VAIADELRFLGDRIALSPGLRFDGVASTLLVAGDGTVIPDQRQGDWFLSPRLAVRARATSWLTLRGSAGRFVRFPTLLELFGDGAFIIGRPQLVSESAWGGDVGAAFSVEKRRFALRLETVFFGREVENLIVYALYGRAAAAINIGRARMLGAEARFSGTLGRLLHVSLDYTFLDGIDLTETSRHGNQLPGRPRHQLAFRAEVRGGPFRLFYDLDHVSNFFFDPDNYRIIPGRTLHALGASLLHGAWSISVEVRNLADLRIVDLPFNDVVNAGRRAPYPLVDFFDYPLPGRALYGTVAYQTQ